MRLAEFVKINGKAMKMMSNFGIRINDYQYTEMYEDYANMLKNNEKKEYIETLEAIKWNNYLTRKEAEKIVSNMNPKAPWTWQEWVQAMNNLGLHGEEEPYYNSYALWVVMNMVYSDHAETLAKEVWNKSVKEIPAETWVKTTYALALDKLKDKDEVFDVREYFNV